MTRLLTIAALVSIALLASGASDPYAGVQPELYGAGLFSTGQWDFFMAFSPDQRRVLFCRANDDFTSYRIYETRRDDRGRWGAPTLPTFDGGWSNADPHITQDGHTVFFISNRPAPGKAEPESTMDIWYAQLGADGEWGEPTPVGAPVNMPGDEWAPAVAANGNLYFGTDRSGGVGHNDIWMARRVGDHYEAPTNLGEAINTPAGEVEPWIAPDESYLIFSGRGRKDGVGAFDLYVSRRGPSGWGPAKLIGHGVNSPQADFNQSVSPDGKYLYFSSTRPYAGPKPRRVDSAASDSALIGIGNGKGDIYRIPVKALGL
jgi:Tol biopolymer transport system component